jgi:hypothetical protein
MRDVTIAQGIPEDYLKYIFAGMGNFMKIQFFKRVWVIWARTDSRLRHTIMLINLWLPKNAIRFLTWRITLTY